MHDLCILIVSFVLSCEDVALRAQVLFRVYLTINTIQWMKPVYYGHPGTHYKCLNYQGFRSVYIIMHHFRL